MKAYSSKEYSFEDAAHLLRRAGFGGMPTEVEELRKLGPKLAVEKLRFAGLRTRSEAMQIEHSHRLLFPND